MLAISDLAITSANTMGRTEGISMAGALVEKITGVLFSSLEFDILIIRQFCFDIFFTCLSWSPRLLPLCSTCRPQTKTASMPYRLLLANRLL
jgi:hypothetical protein